MTTTKDTPTPAKKVEQPMTEAPASLNFHGVTKGGWTVQFTLRDVNEYVLLTRFGDFVKKLEDYYVTPRGKPVTLDTPPPSAPMPDAPPTPEFPNADPGYCKVHDTKMFENSNERGTWWSHKTDDPAYSTGFCKGKAAK